MRRLIDHILLAINQLLKGDYMKKILAALSIFANLNDILKLFR